MSKKIGGLNFISLSAAAEIAGMSNDRFGRILTKYLVPNGVRVYNTAKNNKGILICLEDINLVVHEAIAECVPIIDIILD